MSAGTTIAEVSVRAAAAQLGEIFYFVVLPILLLVALGFLLQWALGLDMPTLQRLSLYFVLPGLVYFSLVSSRVTAGDAGTVVLFTAAMMACMSLLTYGAALVRRVPADQRRAMAMTAIFHNSGNFGLPLQDLAWRGQGLSAQAQSHQVFVIVTQNFTTFTYGVLLAAGGGSKQQWKQSLRHIARFPSLYALVAALITIQVRNWLGDHAPDVSRGLAPFWQTISYVRDAFIATALCTLGAKLALLTRGGPRYPVGLSVILRLLIAPAVGLGLIFAFGLRGFMAQVLLISTSSPTAVNCMLLCLEFDNHPDYAAKAVFYSTLLSPITVTGVIYLAQSGVLGL